MPSVFNHENSCWGVKRTFCNVFQNDCMQTRKLSEFYIAPNLNSVTSSNNSVQYSVSSNGYYGYHPHSIVQDQTNDNAMEIEENGAVSSIVLAENAHIGECNGLASNPHCPSVTRKRHMADDSVDNTKRMRQEECGDGDSRLRHTRYQTSREDLHDDVGYESITTQLLRQTHGCEFYLYERNCDY